MEDRVRSYFEAGWGEPVRVTRVGRVKVRRARGRRARGADRSLGCVAEVVLEVLAQLVWPVAAVWDLIAVRNRRGKAVATASGPRGGQAFSVAERLTRYSGEIVVVRGASRLALVEAVDADPVEVWCGQGKNCPQWSPSPACLYWEDGSMLLFSAG